jgi:hypothetical protein
MPKHQSSAAKKARAAARKGAKYTAALREVGQALDSGVPNVQICAIA